MSSTLPLDKNLQTKRAWWKELPVRSFQVDESIIIYLTNIKQEPLTMKTCGCKESMEQLQMKQNGKNFGRIQSIHSCKSNHINRRQRLLDINIWALWSACTADFWVTSMGKSRKAVVFWNRNWLLRIKCGRWGQIALRWKRREHVVLVRVTTQAAKKKTLVRKITTNIVRQPIERRRSVMMKNYKVLAHNWQGCAKLHIWSKHNQSPFTFYYRKTISLLS